METLDKIKKQISENPILIYMKGSPKFPSCGFSARAVEALINCGVPFGYVDIYNIRIFVPNYRLTQIGRHSHNYGWKAS
ncbi:Monothiol glutaredoxin [Aggregatibacter aphrophilus]|uniref:Monothiol glutaredoxin n=1 Tax=Aggregatibacter aphrophilus TaxID=732 RepID=A0A336NEM3_AGGAP|nr:Monothiol glutaredoxin [Aggregatibacter aphrophilus]